MSVDRRDMVKAVALGGAAMAAGAGPAAASAETGKIVHHVFFWLKNPGSAADRDQLIAGLRTLAAIPVIRSLQIGVPASTWMRAPGAIVQDRAQNTRMSEPSLCFSMRAAYSGF